MIVRFSIANIDARGLARRLQAAGLDGTCFDHVGTARWGVEAGATLETVLASPNGILDIAGSGQPWDSLRDFVVHTLRDLREEAAYLTIDGRLAFILTAGEWVGPDPREYVPQPLKVDAL
jgi:hypothetical protein